VKKLIQKFWLRDRYGFLAIAAFMISLLLWVGPDPYFPLLIQQSAVENYYEGFTWESSSLKFGVLIGGFEYLFDARSGSDLKLWVFREWFALGETRLAWVLTFLVISAVFYVARTGVIIKVTLPRKVRRRKR
jgi:hypothetical protein